MIDSSSSSSSSIPSLSLSMSATSVVVFAALLCSLSIYISILLSLSLFDITFADPVRRGQDVQMVLMLRLLLVSMTIMIPTPPVTE